MSVGSGAPPCEDWLVRGHFCEGLVPVDGAARHLCFACDAGRPCERDVAVVRAAVVRQSEQTPAERVINGEEVRIAPGASMGAEILGKPKARKAMGKKRNGVPAPEAPPAAEMLPKLPVLWKANLTLGPRVEYLEREELKQVTPSLFWDLGEEWDTGHMLEAE